jgi:hypothetical protein|tara:strand:- start:68480 stop:68674 length:195 start_codon:yes stop_codon:yes gene_type:complete
MSINRAVMLLAGSFVLISIALAWLVHPLWILLAVFVGANLVQSSFTGFCPAAMIFRSLGLKGSV